MWKPIFGLAVAVVITCSLASAQESKGPEQLPLPRAEPDGLPAYPSATPHAGPVIVLPVVVHRPEYPRPGRRSVWQLYEVDSTGHFQPRVVYSPWGAYYQHTGAPYPVPQTRPGEWSRFISQ